MQLQFQANWSITLSKPPEMKWSFMGSIGTATVDFE